MLYCSFHIYCKLHDKHTACYRDRIYCRSCKPLFKETLISINSLSPSGGTGFSGVKSWSGGEMLEKLSWNRSKLALHFKKSCFLTFLKFN